MADRYALAAAGAVLVWSTNALAAGMALERLTVPQVLALQFGAAAAVILAVRFAGRGTRATVDVRGVAVGVVGLGGAIALQYIAFATAPLIAANAIAYAWPVMVAAWLASRHAAERGSRTPLGLAVVGFAGVVLILSQRGSAGDEASAPLVGYAAALGSALAMAWYSLAAGRTPGSRSTLLLVATAAGAAATIPLALAQGAAWSPPAAIALGLYTGLGPMAAGYALWTYAMSHPAGARLAPVAYATPLLSTLVLVAGGERLSPLGFAGCALIIVCAAGVLVDRRELASEEPAARRRAAEALLVERGVDADERDLGGEAGGAERVDPALATRRLG
jgi:drug/metabolite transporter (DMT)-like permease